MQRATVGKSDCEAGFVVITLNRESILQQQFGENPGNDCCYSIYFNRLVLKITITRLLMTILGLTGVLFCKMSRHGQNGLSFVPKKLTSVPREARGGLKAVAD